MPLFQITGRGASYNGKIHYRTMDGQTLQRQEKGNHIPLRLISLEKTVDDRVLLDDMNIPLIMHSLKDRCKRDQIYTNVGTILIFINPYKLLPLYTPSMMEKYAKPGDKEMPPHPILLVIGVIIIYGMKRVRINLSLYQVNPVLAKRKPQKSF